MTIENILTSPALAGMRALRQWIVYFVTPDPKKPGKLIKLPTHYQTRSPCSVVDAANWTDVYTAAQSALAWGPSFGVAFCFTKDDPYWFVDLDSCLQDDGQWSPLAQQIVGQALPGAAIEISASGKGIHLFGRGTVPAHSSKNIEYHAELYTEGRFCALTGTALAGDCDLDLTPGISWVAQTYFEPRTAAVGLVASGPCAEWRGPADDEELLRRAMQSRSAGSRFSGKASFSDLWLRDVDALSRTYPGDGEGGVDWSSADAALAQLLAFWTGRDQQRMTDLMRRSGLAREKYERPDYLPRTVANACGMQRDVLQDKLPEPAPTLGPAMAPPSVPAPPAATSGPPSPPTPVAAASGSTMRPIEGSTFLTPDQQATMFNGCFYVVEQHRVLMPGGRMLKPEQFKALFGGYSFLMDGRNERTSKDAFEAFTQSQAVRAPRADNTCFKPQLPYGALVQHGLRTLVNTYWPAQVARAEGDATPFFTHLAKLVPDEYERQIVFYFMCGLVQHIGRKAQWCMVMQGVEGNGKTLLARFLARAVGPEYTYWARPDKLAKDFNGYLVGKILVLGEEIMVGDRQDFIEVLKPMITAVDGIEIERKGVDQMNAEICCNFWFTTNHRDAIRKTRNDRRFFCLQTAQQNVEDLSRDGITGEYMHQIHEWANHGGFAIVAQVLASTPIPPQFDFTKGMQRAPITRSTELAINASMGVVEQEVLDSVEREEVGFRGGWISSGFFDKLLVRIGKDRAVPISKRKDLLESLGYRWQRSLSNGRVNNIVLPDGAKVKLYVRQDREDLQALAPAEAAAAYSAAQGVAAGAPAAR